MNVNARAPVLVGVAHVEQRIDDVNEAREPIDLMEDAIRLALEDTGRPDLVEYTTSIRVIKGVWPYTNPARFLASNLNLNGVETGITVFGGNGVQSTLNDACVAIRDGRHEVVMITGAECGRTQARARKSKVELKWRDVPGTPDWQLRSNIGQRNDVEAARGVGSAILMYPLFDNALRYLRNETVDQHITRISQLWSRFSKVATTNPHAWIRDFKTATEIRTPGPSNRHVSFPYPKLMNANNNVDQGAALVLCSQDLAKKLGVPRDKWIYPWAGTDAHDTYVLSQRANFHSAPGLRTAAAKCLEMSELTPDEVDHVDIYSCFPSAVQVAAREIGFNEQRPLTVTGGLTFGGGPLNNYVTHAIVRMAEILRTQPDAKGLVTANGGILTKHAMVVYSKTPPKTIFQHRDVQDAVPKDGQRDVELQPQGELSIETYSIAYHGDNPARGIVSCLSESGTRTWGTVADRDVLQDMTESEYCGRSANMASDGTLTIG